MDSSKEARVEKSRGKERGANLWFPLLLIVFCITFEYFSSLHLPQQGNLVNGGRAGNTETFSVVNARKNLKELTNFGPRVTGSRVTELSVTRYLKDKVKAVAKDLPSGVRIEIDQQNPASNFYLDFLGGMTNVYKNVSNVVVRISWTDDAAPSSITDYDLTPVPAHKESPPDNDFAVLVNAHFDSIPGSPGAADDGIGVACMIEVLRILAHGPRLKHPIILLFNGAEEGNHQAAHGFITQHRWAPQVKYVFNLEAIGSGGQEMMFQCNSGWLAAFYGKMAPHPHASVMAHELFKHLLHRMASTDWSTLLKYGSPGIRGIDTAYIQNGYVYHTTFDTADIVPNGTLVNTGENILYLTKALASSPEVPNFTQQDHQDELSVFFDLGGVLFVYTGVNVTIIHTLVALLCVSLVYALSRSVSNLSATKLKQFMLAEIYAYFMPILAGALFGLVVFFVCPMRWYEGGLKWAVLLYVPPVLLTILHVRGQTSAGVLNTPQIRLMSGLLFPWLLWLVSGIIFGVMSVYVCCLWIVNVALAVGVYTIVRYYTLRHAQPPTRYMYSPEFFYLLALLPMLYLWSTVARLFLTMTLPLLGKSGTTVPTDPAVGALIGALLSGPAPLILAHNLEQPVLSKTSLRASVTALGVILLIATVFTTPYSAERPKRLWIQHLHRSFITHPASSHALSTGDVAEPAAPAVRTDCGLWISAFDEQGMTPLQSIGVGRLDGRHRSSNDCSVWDGDCYLKFPWYFPVSEVLRDAHYIPTECPAGIAPSHVLTLSLSSIPLEDSASSAKSKGSAHHAKDALRLVRVSLRGPNHMHLVVRDNHQGQRIEKWYIPAATLEASAQAGEVLMDMAYSTATGCLEHAKIIDTPVAPVVSSAESVRAVLPMVTPPVVRAEGVFFLSMGFGLCSDKEGCLQDVYLLVRGNAPVELAAYGHYTDQTDDTVEMKELMQDLPAWSRGAEWTKFPSHLVHDSV